MVYFFPYLQAFPSRNQTGSGNCCSNIKCMLTLRTCTLSFVLVLLFSLQGFSQKKTFHCRKTAQIIEFIQQNHYSAPPVDSMFNQQLNQQFITSLDPLGLFFTTEDTDFIHAFIPDITNLDCADNKNFMEYIVNLFRMRLEESELIIKDLLSGDLDFAQGDTLFIPEPQTTKYPTDAAGIEQNWNRYLRFQLLRYFISTYRSNDSTFIRSNDNFLASLDTLKADILQREACKFNHLLNYPGGFDEYIFSIYLNTLTSSFDPHTNYFSMNDKEQFESSLSKSKNSFGADLEQNDDGEIVIARLIPGGPAWRSGEMNAGDILLSIRFPEQDPTDLICSNLSEIQDLIYNSGADQVEVTFRSQLGQVKTLELRIESVAAAENAVYSFILHGNKKIGYISLPGFYTEPDKKDPLGCASDLVNEINKLEQDGIEGLLLDVRNNGGGSIVEAVDLAGVFIDAGPLCIYTTRYEKPSLIKDLKRGTRYNGPLILLVNGFSASAAEILAATLQDYHRALIVGTPTFGKASGQVILPLGDPGTTNEEMYYYGFDPTDFIKITTTRYYRLNGTTHQASGIQPDIALPRLAGYDKMNESEYPSAFFNDTIHKNVTFEPFSPLPIDSLRSISEIRVNQNSNFTAFRSINDSIRPLYSGKLFIPLDFDDFILEYNKNFGLFERLDELKATPGINYEIKDNRANEAILKQDSYKNEIHQEIIGNLTKDYFLEETYFIMEDLINLTPSVKLNQ